MPADEFQIDPDELRNARFPGSSRRYDARSVDQFLEKLAERVEGLNRRLNELARERDDARRGVRRAGAHVSILTEPTADAEDGSTSAVGDDTPAVEVPAPEPSTEPTADLGAAEPAPVITPAVAGSLSDMDDDELMRLVGEETAEVLTTARRVADQIRTKAEESAARLIREATTEADAIAQRATTEAESLTREAQEARDRAVEAARVEGQHLREEAEREAARTLAEAEDQAAARIASGETRLAEAREEAASVTAEAREDGRRMLDEAREVRSRVLDDMQRRRDAARAQIEWLLDGRERLLDAYGSVRRSLDEITSELSEVLPEPPTFHPVHGDLTAIDDPTDAPSVTDSAAEDDVSDDRSRAGEKISDGNEIVDDDTVAPPVGSPSPVADDDGVFTGEAIDAPEQDVGAVVVDPDAGVDPEPVPAAETPDDPDDAGLQAATATATATATGDVHGDSAGPVVIEAEEPAMDDEAAPAGSASDETVPPESDEADPVDAIFARMRADRAADRAAKADAASDGDAALAGEGGAGTEDEHIDTALLAPADALGRRKAVLDDATRPLVRALKRELADEQNLVLDRLRTEGVGDDLLPARDAHVAQYADAALDLLYGVAAAAAADGASADPEVGSLAQELGVAIADPFRRRFERAVEAVDGDADELDDRLRSLYREWKTQLIEPAAIDALVAAYAVGTLDGVPDGGGLRWCIDPEQGPCPDAEDNALAGVTACGQEFPTGDLRPPAHPGCRCLLVVERPR